MEGNLITGGGEYPRFVSLGMVVLDELHFPDRESLYDVLGGSGTYGKLAPLCNCGLSYLVLTQKQPLALA